MLSVGKVSPVVQCWKVVLVVDSVLFILTELLFTFC